MSDPQRSFWLFSQNNVLNTFLPPKRSPPHTVVPLPYDGAYWQMTLHTWKSILRNFQLVTNYFSDFVSTTTLYILAFVRHKSSHTTEMTHHQHQQQQQQHLINHREAIHGWRPPQFVVALAATIFDISQRGYSLAEATTVCWGLSSHNIWYITERLFTHGGHHSLLRS